MKINKLSQAITAALSIGVNTAQAQFPMELELSSLNGINGFTFFGQQFGGTSSTWSMRMSISSAGDVNGDGFDDIIIGDVHSDTSYNYYSRGISYVVFGGSSGFPNSMNASTINGSNGFVIDGFESIFPAGQMAGESVSSAGDINGDGIDDLIIGAWNAEQDFNQSNGSRGRSYVVFGSTAGLPNPLYLTTLNGSNGFIIRGINDGDSSGKLVSSAGDINGDGIDDVIITAPGIGYGSSSYVVFGSGSGLPNPMNLSTINGSNGFVIHEESFLDSVESVSSAGDINDDGIDDVIIGVPNAGSSGKSYVIFGSSTGLSNPLNLSTINGSNGFVINGENSGDYSGNSVSSAGDVNGDGIGDVIINKPSNGPSGRAYVVFGSSTGLPNPLNLSSLNGSNGFVIHGSVVSVSSAGDVNGDAIDDVIIGNLSFCGWNCSMNQSILYVVFGQEKPIFLDGFENP